MTEKRRFALIDFTRRQDHYEGLKKIEIQSFISNTRGHRLMFQNVAEDLYTTQLIII